METLDISGRRAIEKEKTMRLHCQNKKHFGISRHLASENHPFPLFVLRAPLGTAPYVCVDVRVARYNYASPKNCSSQKLEDKEKVLVF